ncbi:Protein fam83g [Saguinus oedipus]|uniref:Protein fam83g n=1 Tax=Saguinus oedipus TaxID=9490 RepID=A0ABQ9VNR1_SAGOE|nr:Protein fam83g [Saguinus oedipus]
MSPRSSLHLRFYFRMPSAILDTWVSARLALPFLGSAMPSTSLYPQLLPHHRPCYRGERRQRLDLVACLGVGWCPGRGEGERFAVSPALGAEPSRDRGTEKHRGEAGPGHSPWRATDYWSVRPRFRRVGPSSCPPLAHHALTVLKTCLKCVHVTLPLRTPAQHPPPTAASRCTSQAGQLCKPLLPGIALQTPLGPWSRPSYPTCFVTGACPLCSFVAHRVPPYPRPCSRGHSPFLQASPPRPSPPHYPEAPSEPQAASVLPLPCVNLRVRSSGGTEFFTRSATKFKGALAQKFMFVDGDRAVCGSYRHLAAVATTCSTTHGVQGLPKLLSKSCTSQRGTWRHAICRGRNGLCVTDQLDIPASHVSALYPHSLLDPRALWLWSEAQQQWCTGRGRKRGPVPDQRPSLCCSFTWSASRTDRNVISVLSGQVVEMFDRQFQELYLMSHSVSLKGIPMEKEPEPEPIVLPSVVPLVPSGTVAKKLVNPKYALVKAKSVDEIAKISSEKQEAKKPPGLQGVALAERPGDLPELPPPVHPGLLHLEKANMFEYLPTWVEPDPEPGSDILGYINIIDPNIWNPQPSQMNRIKIRDTSQASAQHQLWKQSQDSRPHPEPHPPQEPGAPQDSVPDENGLPEGNPEPSPPVPKPRTVPVADVLAQDSSGIGWALETPKEEAPQNGTDHGLPRTAGLGHTPLQRQLSVTEDDPDSLGVGIPNGLDGMEEEDDDDYVTLSDQDSHSGSSSRGPGPRRLSVASSSVSEEYFEVREHSAPLRRRHSEQVANGPIPPPRRQLSAPHITRGTFSGPLGGSPWAQSRGREEANASRRIQAQRSIDKEAQ